MLVEKCIEGTEITVGVYGEDDVRALPIVEIRKPEDCEFYDLDVSTSTPQTSTAFRRRFRPKTMRVPRNLPVRPIRPSAVWAFRAAILS